MIAITTSISMSVNPPGRVGDPAHGLKRLVCVTTHLASAPER